MKNILLALLFVCLLPSLGFSQKIYSNKTGGGNWNNAETWDGGTIPTSVDTVEIRSGDTITVDTIQYCKLFIIDATDTSNYGTLAIETGATLTTTASCTVYGILKITGGTFNEGDGSGDYLTINGSVMGNRCLFNMSGGILNTSRYFTLKNSASFKMTGGTININSSGGTSATDIFYVPSGTTFTMSNGNINILKGNKGDGAALKFNPTTANVTGGIISFTNTDNYMSSTTMISTKTLYNINCDVGTGDTLVIKNMSSTTEGFSCNNFIITSGTAVINPGYGMTVNDTLTNNGTSANLIIASDTTGNGSLITNSSVDVTVQRYVGHYTSGTGTGNGWHEIGCPVASMDPANTTWDPTRNTTDDLYAWSEVDNQWVNYRNTTFTFTAGQGYLVANSTDLTHEYTGTLNTSDVTVSNLSYTSTSGGDGWHLLGNPFSSAIKWDDGNWTLTNVGAVAEIWDEASASYTAINANDIIPSTNGFFVQVVSGTTGSVTIPAAARVHDAQGNYKQTAETPETLTFQITDDANSYSDKATLGFKPDATEQWDMAYDAHKIMSMVKTAPQIWTVSHDENFLINYLPEITTAYDVPLEFRAGVNTVYHLTIKGVSSFTNTDFILEDKVTGEKINLNEITNYDFSAQDGDNTDRFVLHINGVTGISPASEQTDDLQVFSSGNTIYLHGQKVLNGKVFVFNTLGQKVYESILNGTTRQQIHMTQQAGIYIVRIENDHRVVTKKVYIQ
ncbi:T9SS type A sorting domain-containing protein [Candidatus Sulfidibacterium hydrothermale]|uniref:T9SS type A sorting domain-containing protein n=1 Tax=Candidatus Sulfidibacterium hydrothermale TaxID=2875962 RepID=UPI001F0A70DC|nr:T9SS type A sorting domain-containing protein [Candidatus Sulfidibacterium hydrothermale]UBM62974.1 T9SS type A sorting domain-containing protein [Candidatus Sulfidibacterium hydrothermale]